MFKLKDGYPAQEAASAPRWSDTLAMTATLTPIPHILVQLAADVDLLLAETSFLDTPDNHAGMHLSTQQSAATGQAADVPESG